MIFVLTSTTSLASLSNSILHLTIIHVVYSHTNLYSVAIHAIVARNDLLCAGVPFKLSLDSSLCRVHNPCQIIRKQKTSSRRKSRSLRSGLDNNTLCGRPMSLCVLHVRPSVGPSVPHGHLTRKQMA